MAARSPLSILLLPVLLLVGTEGALASAQDVDAQKERARGLITELFYTRLDLQLGDLEEALQLGPNSLDDARDQGRTAVVGWLDEHPVKLKSQGSIAWTATPIEHTPFAEFAGCDAWAAVKASSLTDRQREELDARNEAREVRAIERLAGLIERRLARALYLTEKERKALGPVCAAAARERWKLGVVERFEGPFGGMLRSEDRLREVLDEGALLAALSAARRSIVADMLKEGRTSVHDLRLEAEFHLYGRADIDDERRILYGLADAVLHRGGRVPKDNRWPLEPISGLKGKADWRAGISGVLGFEGKPPGIPRDEESGNRLRAEFLVAVLDQRACFTEEQRESLIPLMVAYVAEEPSSSRGGAAMELFLPRVLGVSQDGLLVPGENDSLNNASTKVRSLVKTLYEACSQKQRDVLRS